MKSWVRSALAALLTMALTLPAFAAEDTDVIFPRGDGKSAPAAVAAGDRLNSVSLVVGVLLAAVGGWLYWRNRRRIPAGREARALAINETRSLGNRQYLVVASHEGKRFLLGVCPGQISFLSALPDSTDPEGRK